MSLQLYPLNECSLILGMIGAIKNDGGGVCVCEEHCGPLKTFNIHFFLYMLSHVDELFAP